MDEYGIGGVEVPKDASEAITDIPQNRTLFAQKLTENEPIAPELVFGLKTVDEVFERFKPKANVEFDTLEGGKVNESFQFKNLSDFSTKSITEKSKFLSDLKIQEDQYVKIVRQLKTNRLLKSVLENPEMRNAFVNSLKALAQELDENKD